MDNRIRTDKPVFVASPRDGFVSIMTTPGFVYFIAGAGMVKVGWATDPHKRMAQMQAHSPVILTLLFALYGSGELERKFHWCFSRFRRHGEWFEASQEVLKAIADLKDAASRDGVWDEDIGPTPWAAWPRKPAANP